MFKLIFGWGSWAIVLVTSLCLVFQHQHDVDMAIFILVFWKVAWGDG